MPEMIDFLVKDIPNARKGFRMFFSAAPFPGYQKKLVWRREEMGGNVYRRRSADGGLALPGLVPVFRQGTSRIVREGRIEEGSMTHAVSSLYLETPGRHRRPAAGRMFLLRPSGTGTATFSRLTAASA